MFSRDPNTRRKSVEGMAWATARALTLATLRDLQRLAPEAKRQAFMKMLAASTKGASHD